MYVQWLKNLFKAKEQPVQAVRYGLDNLDDDVIGYPPNPAGIPVVQTQTLVEKMSNDINILRTEIGVSNAEFNDLIYPCLINFIQFVDLLPASEYKHHATGGGLVYHSFDVAKRAVRASQHAQYPLGDGVVSDTQQSNMQWRVATVLCCLLHDGGKVITDLVVSDGDNSVDALVWDAHSGQTLNEWAAEYQLERYYVSWTKDRHQKHKNASIAMMQRLIPAATWSWIDSCFDGKAIHTAMLNAIAGTDTKHTLSGIITKCDADSVKHDMWHKSSHITREIKRTPLSELLADLIRHHVIKDEWLINKKNAKLWFVDEELFIVWDNAVDELVEEMNNAGYNIPEVPVVLARLMCEEAMAVEFKENEPYHDIYPEILGDAKKPVKLRCLRLRFAARFVPDIEKVYSLGQHKLKAENTESTSVDIPESEYVESREPVGQTKNNSLPSTDVQDEQLDAQKPHFETALTTVQRVVKLMAKTPANPTVPTPQTERSNETSRSNFKSELAQYISSHFSFEIVNNCIALPSSKVNEVAESLIKANLNGISALNAMKLLRTDAEIQINE